MLFLASMAILKFRATAAICGFTFYQYEIFVLKGLYIIPKYRVLGCSTCPSSSVWRYSKLLNITHKAMISRIINSQKKIFPLISLAPSPCCHLVKSGGSSFIFLKIQLFLCTFVSFPHSKFLTNIKISFLLSL